MRLRVCFVAAVTALATACSPPPREFDSGTAIENVSVVDPAAGSVAAGRTVVVQGTRIAAVSAPDELLLGEGVERIDGGGGYLIPGLWDMHVHEFSPFFEPALRVYIANGVTAVRDMWGDLGVAREAQGWHRGRGARGTARHHLRQHHGRGKRLVPGIGDRRQP